MKNKNNLCLVNLKFGAGVLSGFRFESENSRNKRCTKLPIFSSCRSENGKIRKRENIFPLKKSNSKSFSGIKWF